jgi:hypothetical protein
LTLQAADGLATIAGIRNLLAQALLARCSKHQ